MPLYLKRAISVKDNPLYNESKVIYSIYDDASGKWNRTLLKALKLK